MILPHLLTIGERPTVDDVVTMLDAQWPNAAKEADIIIVEWPHLATRTKNVTNANVTYRGIRQFSVKNEIEFFTTTPAEIAESFGSRNAPRSAVAHAVHEWARDNSVEQCTKRECAAIALYFATVQIGGPAAKYLEDREV